MHSPVRAGDVQSARSLSWQALISVQPMGTTSPISVVSSLGLYNCQNQRSQRSTTTSCQHLLLPCHQRKAPFSVR